MVALYYRLNHHLHHSKHHLHLSTHHLRHFSHLDRDRYTSLILLSLEFPLNRHILPLNHHILNSNHHVLPLEPSTPLHPPDRDRYTSFISFLSTLFAGFLCVRAVVSTDTIYLSTIDYHYYHNQHYYYYHHHHQYHHQQQHYHCQTRPTRGQSVLHSSSTMMMLSIWIR